MHHQNKKSGGATLAHLVPFDVIRRNLVGFATALAAEWME
jgi:hypothetical protein